MKFQFQLEGEHLNSNQWAYDNGYIEGDLQIYVNGALYLAGSYMNVVELAIQLGKWLESIRLGVTRDFIYESIDHDEPILLFTMEQDGIRVSAPWQRFEVLEPLPINVVETAVKTYLIILNRKLHEINYVAKLDRFLSDDISENMKAIMLFEQNEYDEAFVLFKKLAEEVPSIQSINNFAWIVLREEEDRDEAERLLQKILALQPQSPFPYMMLGEIALHKQQYEQAKSYLQQALSYKVMEEATYNLAIAHFQLGEYEQAAQTFAHCVGDSGLTQLHEVVAWMYAGEHNQAKALLDDWNEDAYDYTGAIEIADVYIELGCFAEAREQFEKEWNSYITSPYIISRFTYTLIQLGNRLQSQSVINQAITQADGEITDEFQIELDENWTAENKAERIAELTEQKRVLEALYGRLQNGYVPPFEYDMYPMGGCQLFGCTQHGNPEYEGA